MKKEQVTIAIVAALALIGVVTGVILVLSELDSVNAYKEIKDDGMRTGPGTILIYDVSIDKDGMMIRGTATYEILGQNPSGHMYRLLYNLTNPDGTKYNVESRIRLTNDGGTVAISTGMGNISTISGKLKMPYVEYMSSGEAYRDYYNPYNNIMYLSTSQTSSSTVELKTIEANWQTSDEYVPSSNIGYETVYSISGISNGVSISGTYSEIVVAEDNDGRVGIRSLSTTGDYSNISYLFDTLNTEGIQITGSGTRETIDGSKDLIKYSYTIDGVDHERYIDGNTGICYLLKILSGTDSINMELTSYGINNTLWS